MELLILYCLSKTRSINQLQCELKEISDILHTLSVLLLMNFFFALFKLHNSLDKREEFYQELLLLGIKFFSFYRNILL